MVRTRFVKMRDLNRRERIQKRRVNQTSIKSGPRSFVGPSVLCTGKTSIKEIASTQESIEVINGNRGMIQRRMSLFFIRNNIEISSKKPREGGRRRGKERIPEITSPDIRSASINDGKMPFKNRGERDGTSNKLISRSNDPEGTIGLPKNPNLTIRTGITVRKVNFGGKILNTFRWKERLKNSKETNFIIQSNGMNPMNGLRI